MNPLPIPNATGVVLSRRNLEGLLEQLDAKGAGAITRFTEEGSQLWVIAEENDVHYGDRPAGHSSPSPRGRS